MKTATQWFFFYVDVIINIVYSSNLITSRVSIAEVILYSSDSLVYIYICMYNMYILKAMIQKWKHKNRWLRRHALYLVHTPQQFWTILTAKLVIFTSSVVFSTMFLKRIVLSSSFNNTVKYIKEKIFRRRHIRAKK